MRWFSTWRGPSTRSARCRTSSMSRSGCSEGETVSLCSLFRHPFFRNGAESRPWAGGDSGLDDRSGRLLSGERRNDTAMPGCVPQATVTVSCIYLQSTRCSLGLPSEGAIPRTVRGARPPDRNASRMPTPTGPGNPSAGLSLVRITNPRTDNLLSNDMEHHTGWSVLPRESTISATALHLAPAPALAALAPLSSAR